MSFGLKRLVMAMGATALVASTASAVEPTESATFTLDAESRLAALEEEVAALKNDSDINVYWKKGLYFETNDKKFKLKLGGRIQNDWAWFDGDGPVESVLEDGTEFRRARMYISGTFYEHFEYKAQYDFADGDADFKDVYVGAKGVPAVGKIRIGQFKEPFGLETLTSSNNITFMERSLANVFAPSRSTGVMVGSAIADDKATWHVGVFRDSDSYGDHVGNGDYAVTGRVTFLPWAGESDEILHVGAAYSLRNPSDDVVRFRERPEAHLSPRVVDTRQGDIDIAAEDVNVGGAEAALVVGPLSVQGEYIMASVDGDDGAEDYDFSGYYVYASYFLTEGDHRKYSKSKGAFSGISPKKNAFDGGGGAGAIEVAARYSFLDLEDSDIDNNELTDITVGVNWYLNPITRIMANYITADAEDTGDVDVFQLRFQLAF